RRNFPCLLIGCGFLVRRHRFEKGDHLIDLSGVQSGLETRHRLRTLEDLRAYGVITTFLDDSRIQPWTVRVVVRRASAVVAKGASLYPDAATSQFRVREARRLHKVFHLVGDLHDLEFNGFLSRGFVLADQDCCGRCNAHKWKPDSSHAETLHCLFSIW